MLECILGPEVDDLFSKLDQRLPVFLGFQLLERNHDGAHEVADFQRTLAADEDGDATVITRMQRLRHDVQAVHAADTVLVVDFEGIVVFQGQCIGRATRDDVVNDVLATLLRDVVLDLVLVDLHVVTPGTDDSKVSTLDGVLAVIRATRDLELELVRQGRTVNVVGEVVDEQAVCLLLVGAGHFATRCANAGHRGTDAGTGAAEVPAVVVDLVEEVLRVRGVGTDEHDVTGLAVECDQARTVLLPAVSQLAQHGGAVVVARRRLNAQRVEFFRLRECVADLGETRDDTATILIDGDCSAFPVTLAGFVGVFQLTQEVAGYTIDTLIRVLVTQTLDTGDKARPWTAFQLVQHRSMVFRCHLVSSPKLKTL